MFTPSILTIIGVIMYLRFGWVVGNAGLAKTLLIVTLANGITLITGLSISEIATNLRVRVGGAYFMISRSLSWEVGGAVGLPLYLAQTFSVSLYVVGFSESVHTLLPFLPIRPMAFSIVVGIVALVLGGARTTIRGQYLIMGIVFLSLISFFLGQGDAVTPVLGSTYLEPGTHFWKVFAVFFPAVTGIMAGVNLSGDLKDPRKSLPLGTLAAILVGYVIYILVPIKLAYSAEPEVLVRDTSVVMQHIARWPFLIVVGIWGAALSSAIGSTLAAPRVVQALALDRILPPFLGRLWGSRGEPTMAILLTFGLAEVGVLLGDLNAIAPVLTMFFLATYAVINLSSGMQKLIGSTSFRPSFRVPWWLSMAGGMGAVVAMFLINARAALAALGIILGFYFYLKHRKIRTSYGDIRHGLWFALVRGGVLRLEASDWHPRNWQPNILVLVGAPIQRGYLVELGHDLARGRGLVTAMFLLPPKRADGQQKGSLESSLRSHYAREGMDVLVRAAFVDDLYSEGRVVVQTIGFGSIEPNLVLMGWPRGPWETERQGRFLREVHGANRSLVLVKYDEERGFGQRRNIVLFWRGVAPNGGMMLLLAYLLTQTESWRGSHICLKMFVPEGEAVEQVRANLLRLMGGARIQAEVEVKAEPDRERLPQRFQTEVEGADLVFLGLRIPQPGQEAEVYGFYERVLSGFPTTLIVASSPDLNSEDLIREIR